MKKLLCLVGGAMLFFNLFAQKIKALSVGDTIPDLTFDSIINYKTTTAKLSDFKNRLVIFDFWATWCTNCLAAFPHNQSLQRQFGDSIMVMLVNSKNSRDNYSKIIKLFERQSRLKMPSLTGDSILFRLFPHRTIPHYVWIKDGVVRAITSSKDLTAENIRLVLASKKAVLPTKNDYPDFNVHGPLFTDKGVLNKIIEHSILTKYTDQFQGGNIMGLRNNDKFLYCLVFTNIKLLELYSYAYPDVIRKYSSNYIIKESPLLDSIYNYDLQLPPDKDEVFYKRMREDLYRAFHLTVEEEVRSQRCLVLKKKGRTDKLFDTSMAPDFTLDKFFNKRYIHNMSIKLFCNTLNEVSPIPVLDETGISCHITMDDLPYQLMDIPALKQALAPYGLDVNYEIRNLEMCVIRKDANIK